MSNQPLVIPGAGLAGARGRAGAASGARVSAAISARMDTIAFSEP